MSLPERDAFDRLVALLDELDLNCAAEPELLRVRADVGCTHGLFRTVLQLTPGARFLVILSWVQCRVPEAKREAVAEYLLRANHGLYLGGFEFDWDAGTVVYKTVLDVECGQLTRHELRRALSANLSTIDRYLPGLMLVLWGDAEPKDAVLLVEAPDDEAQLDQHRPDQLLDSESEGADPDDSDEPS